jgi:aminoglycoside 6'-N-acetyltransferase I
MITRCTSPEQHGWLALREALWPDTPRATHRAEMAAFLTNPTRHVQLLAHAPDGRVVGLAEASVRAEPVPGTEAAPVAYLEGLYVVPDQRRRGVARALVDAVAAWGERAGCRDLASDVLLENDVSHAVHLALGFDETERIVYYRRAIRGGAAPTPRATE